MKKIILALISIWLAFPVCSQDINELRKMVMHSDVIFAGATAMHTEHYNDYLSQQTYTVTNIDKMVYNPAGFEATDTVLVFQPLRHISLLWVENYEYVEAMAEIKTPEERYTDLYFIRLESGEFPYVAVGAIKNMKWEKFTDYHFPAITDLLQIKKIGDPGERYSKTIDWYIKWNGYPDREFFEFYKNKGIIGDDPGLTGPQLTLARKRFLEGNEKLHPFLKDKFPVDVCTYYLDKMKRIRKTEDPYNERWPFYHALEKLFSFNYDTMEHILMWQMIEVHTDNYDRRKIMDYFIKRTEELLIELKEQEK